MVWTPVSDISQFQGDIDDQPVIVDADGPADPAVSDVQEGAS